VTEAGFVLRIFHLKLGAVSELVSFPIQQAIVADFFLWPKGEGGKRKDGDKYRTKERRL